MFRTLTILFSLFCFVCSVEAQKDMDCETCSSELIKAQDIDTLSVDELRLLSNEIYARKGYRFKNESLSHYFSYKDWYVPKSNNSGIKLSSIEQQNVDVLVKRRKERELERVVIIDYFKGLQQLAIRKDSPALEGVFSNADLLEGESAIDYLMLVLRKIDFDDVDWYKNNALHRVEVDNGYVKIAYSFLITSEGIVLSYNYMSHSDIMESFDTPFSDYMSENEYTVWWVFAYENGKVVFKRINMAG